MNLSGVMNNDGEILLCWRDIIMLEVFPDVLNVFRAWQKERFLPFCHFRLMKHVSLDQLFYVMLLTSIPWTRYSESDLSGYRPIERKGCDSWSSQRNIHSYTNVLRVIRSLLALRLFLRERWNKRTLVRMHIRARVWSDSQTRLIVAVFLLLKIVVEVLLSCFSDGAIRILLVSDNSSFIDLDTVVGRENV